LFYKTTQKERQRVLPAFANSLFIPSILNLSNKHQACKFFSCIDLFKGYQQIPMVLQDIAKTAIITPFALSEYLFNHLPFLFTYWTTTTWQAELWRSPMTNSDIHVDLVGLLPPLHSHTYLFTVIDRTARWPEAIPLSSITTADCVRALFANWIACFGVVPIHVCLVSSTLQPAQHQPFTNNSTPNQTGWWSSSTGG
jgi:hypothetical protein